MTPRNKSSPIAPLPFHIPVGLNFLQQSPLSWQRASKTSVNASCVDLDDQKIAENGVYGVVPSTI
jgi:hypothetical protein